MRITICSMFDMSCHHRGGDARKLIEHYILEHGRAPTDGEIHQFRNYRRKDFAAKKLNMVINKPACFNF